MSKMAASETVRLRLQFDYPPPATPHCTVFWLLVDLNRCRVVTDLISLIRQRFGFSSGALLGLYLEGGLLPPAESARLVRDNDCLRVKLEDGGLPENLVISNGGDSHFVPRKAKKRAFKLVEDEETELGSKCSKKPWKKQEEGHSEKALGPETKQVPDEMGRARNKRKSKVTGSPAEEEEEAKKKSPKRKEKCEHKKQTKASKSSKTPAPKEWSPQNCSSPRGSPRCSPRGSPKGSPKCSPRSSLTKARRKSNAGPKGSPGYLSESDSGPESVGDDHCSVTVQGGTFSEKLSAELLKDGPATKTAAATRQSSKAAFAFSSGKGKAARTSSSSSDSSSESEDQFVVSQNIPEGTSDFLKAAGLFAGQGCPELMVQTPGIMGWKPSDSSRGRQTAGPSPSVPVSSSLGRGWGRGEDFLFGKGLRGRGVRGRGRGRGHAISCFLNRSSESQKQKQLNDILTNSSIVIQNPVETHKKDYSLLPQLAAAPQVGEKIAFKLLELTSDYSPDVSDYKEGKILSHNPETQQVDIEVLSSLPALKEPGKFDLVYHNENGTEVVEYAVTQERRISVHWKELIDPRLIIDSSNSISSK